MKRTRNTGQQEEPNQHPYFKHGVETALKILKVGY